MRSCAASANFEAYGYSDSISPSGLFTKRGTASESVIMDGNIFRCVASVQIQQLRLPPALGLEETCKNLLSNNATLFRYVDPKYHRALLEGGITRIGSLEAYRTQEAGIRADLGEGQRDETLPESWPGMPMPKNLEGRVRSEPGPITDALLDESFVSSCAIRYMSVPTLIVCFSTRCSTALCERFQSDGRNAVCLQIKSIDQVIRAYHAAVLEQYPDAGDPWIHNVVYGPRTIPLKTQRSPFTPVFLKPYDYVPEAEVRLLWQPPSLRSDVKEVFVKLPPLDGAIIRVNNVEEVQARSPFGSVFVTD